MTRNIPTKSFPVTEPSVDYYMTTDRDQMILDSASPNLASNQFKLMSNASSPRNHYAINLKKDTIKKVLDNINELKQYLMLFTPDLEQKYGSDNSLYCNAQTIESVCASISVRVVPNSTKVKCDRFYKTNFTINPNSEKLIAFPNAYRNSRNKISMF